MRKPRCIFPIFALGLILFALSLFSCSQIETPAPLPSLPSSAKASSVPASTAAASTSQILPSATAFVTSEPSTLLSSSVTAAPSSSAFSSAPPSTTVFASTAPASSVHSLAIPSSAPASTIAASTVPASTVPGSSLPGSTVPATTAPPVIYPPCSEDHSRTTFINAFERFQLWKLLSSYEGSVSVYYYSPLTGESYSYGDPNTAYYAASLVKVPYAYYLLQLAERGECDPEQVLELKESWKQSGTGILKEHEAGSQYTVRELITYMITISDNTAFKILRETYSLWDYNKFCRKELGVTNVTYEYITLSDMAKILQTVYEYIDGQSENALFLRDLMAQAVSPLIKAPDADLLIHKHGWADPAFHDMAIVYQDHPYLLILLSDHCEGTREDVKMFSTISRTIKSMQDSLDQDPPPFWDFLRKETA